MLPIRTVLHPTDFSELSQPAFELACSLARDYAARLVVLHVAGLPHGLPVEGMLMPILVDDSEYARGRLEAVRPSDPRVQVRHRLAIGEPAEEILAAATCEEADLIVLGTHGRGGLSRALMGSVAEAVQRAAPCPVVTVRAPFRVSTASPAEAAQLHQRVAG
ncbi:MAG: universal stress protein [Gemmataceae bacterium]|nr:universal stress protein [Gemmataceae bacterium]